MRSAGSLEPIQRRWFAQASEAQSMEIIGEQ